MSHIDYTEKSSKNNSGGLRNIRHKVKEVAQFENDDKTRCHVAFFEKFLSITTEWYYINRFYIMPKNHLGHLGSQIDQLGKTND